jgi:hypothetical protein
MNEEINRLTTIKTIGLTTLIIAGSIALWIVLQFIGTIVFGNSIDRITAGQSDLDEVATEMGDTILQLRILWSATGGLAILTAVGAMGLFGLKRWGLALYQISTIVIALALLGLLIYLGYFMLNQSGQPELTETETDIKANFRVVESYKRFTYGMFLLLFAWMLTRANIFLSKPENRAIFK